MAMWLSQPPPSRIRLFHSTTNIGESKYAANADKIKALEMFVLTNVNEKILVLDLNMIIILHYLFWEREALTSDLLIYVLMVHTLIVFFSKGFATKGIIGFDLCLCWWPWDEITKGKNMLCIIYTFSFLSHLNLITQICMALLQTCNPKKKLRF